MMIGSSSVEDSSSSDSQLLSLRGISRATAGFRCGLSDLESSVTTVVSALALPFESMVNLTAVRMRGVAASGIDVRLERRDCCCCFRGDILPEGRLGGRFEPTAGPLVTCGLG
ncbi:hypothetical protein CH063_00567 [Colletotrichum higginsianum]|uniref:Uncharacterized protein n=1 Tax=Colletotrichum higginsianum (strain IMI 349063) TaxID=759273 RepID=H1VZF2_COLHI|nr:hypothetical protein CH063_00567 [Colletotrichum higginsianum]